MAGFVYSNEKPAQLCYSKDGTLDQLEMLPFWVIDSVTLALAIRMIRARSFGNIVKNRFHAIVYTWPNTQAGDVNPDAPLYPTYVQILDSDGFIQSNQYYVNHLGFAP